MTIEIMEGFDQFGTDLNALADQYTVITSPVLQSGTRFSEGIELYFDSSSDTVYIPLPTNITTGVISFAWKFSGTYADAAYFVRLRESATTQLALSIDSAQRLVVSQSSTILGTSGANTVSSDTWYWIEFKFTIDQSAGAVEVKVNGDTWITLTSQDTQTSGNAYVDLVYLETSGSMTAVVDDVIVQNGGDYLGESRVAFIAPNGDSSVQFNSTGGTNYTEIDEQGPNDSDYVFSATVNNTDLYDFGNLGADAGTIHGIQPIARAQKDTAGTRAIALRTQSGTDDQTGTDNYLATNWEYKQEIFETYDGTNPWTKTLVDAGLFGFKVSV
jgi:hypothetical protein